MAQHQHAHEPRHCKARDFLTLSGEDEAALAEFERLADDYLKVFVAPVREGDKTVCFHCGGELNAFKAMVGLGAAIEWGFVHGEGRCSGWADHPCGWPYRGMHYPKRADGSELFSLSNFFLAYHPDQVSERKQEEAA